MGELRIRNPGPAHNYPIADVGRATSAAPTYFSPLRLDSINERKPQVFKDGAFGTNNPTSEALTEVLALNGERIQKIDAIVSIGTGKPRYSRFGESGLADLVANINSATKIVSDTERVHREMIEKVRIGHPLVPFSKLPYFRFNSNSPKLAEVPLDQWKSGRDSSGKKAPGEITLKVMDEAIKEYCARNEIQAEMRRCAEVLVKRRRLRQHTDPSRWERFALASAFICDQEFCPYRKETYRNEFQEHLTKAHHHLFGQMPHDKLNRHMDRCRERWQYPDVVDKDRPASSPT
jgi:hypothetical protein